MRVVVCHSILVEVFHQPSHLTGSLRHFCDVSQPCYSPLPTTPPHPTPRQSVSSAAAQAHFVSPLPQSLLSLLSRPHSAAQHRVQQTERCLEQFPALKCPPPLSPCSLAGRAAWLVHGRAALITHPSLGFCFISVNGLCLVGNKVGDTVIPCVSPSTKLKGHGLPVPSPV